MGPRAIVLAPWRAARALARSAEDLNALAERARRDPDPVDEARARIEALSAQLETLVGAIAKVDVSAHALGAGGEDLLLATRELNSTARKIETGGKDLTAVAEDLSGSLRVLRAALPQLVEGMDTVAQLEDSVETVAETLEPLQGVAKGVGRVSNRLSR